ncbi:hypothetical protein [Burkholderia thailandensis]|uniref:hypothetical protein n=1 Tax=Burkholderia thailandensis TaxID=57975 RepID=UPI002D764C0E|nr:hypothetical protein [Burkholderia thailandensis]WRS69868.1 hypothetical protein U9S59_29950 [Burkholderia thailandensis]
MRLFANATLIALAAMIVKPVNAQVMVAPPAPAAVVIEPPANPPAIEYVAPVGIAPAPGYLWRYHAGAGWGWWYPHRGWHGGWVPGHYGPHGYWHRGHWR